MVILVSLALVLHVLASTFWAGSTFTLARTGGKSAGQLFGAQMGAAAVTVIAGAYVWAALFGAAEHLVLGIGALFALAAMIAQGAIIGPVRKKVATDPAARARAAFAHRIASGLLLATIVCMVVQ